MEVWKTIKGYENYQVSNTGLVRSLNYKRLGFVKVLKFRPTYKGYIKAPLTKNNITKSIFIHRLVAIAFIPNPQNKEQVNHINGIKTDNRVENLEWVTNSENQIHAYKNKLRKISYNQRVLTFEDALEVRKLFSLGFTTNQISDKYNVSYDVIRNIIKNKTYLSNE